ncbi:hypothetical protein CVT24_001938 [Panaeolus cyanescens]|uniref:Uncharacterized protein n=1 Tax=Panaeolus cyanescens TaxID=181874 RepID=A0A409YHV5_9AGAR|nr:hypothetical protein CVT24_001938 [Panaeolus cyanescens]
MTSVIVKLCTRNKTEDVEKRLKATTDATCDAADTVLTDPDLSTIVHAIHQSRIIFQPLMTLGIWPRFYSLPLPTAFTLPSLLLEITFFQDIFKVTLPTSNTVAVNQGHNQISPVTPQELALLYFLRSQPHALHAFLSSFDEHKLPPPIATLRDNLHVVITKELANVENNNTMQVDNILHIKPNDRLDMRIDVSKNHNEDHFMQTSSDEDDGNTSESAMRVSYEDNDNDMDVMQNSDEDEENNVESEDEELEWDVESEDEDNDRIQSPLGDQGQGPDDVDDFENFDQDTDTDDDQDYAQDDDFANIVDPDKDCHRNAKKRSTRKKLTQQLEKSRQQKQNERTTHPKDMRQKTVRNNGQPIPEHQNLQQHARELLTNICCIARDSIVDENGIPENLDLHNLIRSTILKDNSMDIQSLTNTHEPGTIESMVFTLQTYDKSETIESGIQLHQYLLAIHYAAQVQIYMQQDGKKSISSVHRKVASMTYNPRGIKVHEDRLRRLFSRGLKLAALVAAGSPYILFLLASAQSKTSLNSMVAAQVTAIHHLIRFPDDSPYGILIKNYLIPLVGQLRLRYPISWDFLFEDYITQLGIHPIPTYISDIIACDKVFHCFAFEFFRKERDLNAWAVITQPVDNDDTVTVQHLIAIYHAANVASMSIGQFVQKLYGSPNAEYSINTSPSSSPSPSPSPMNVNIPKSIPENLRTQTMRNKADTPSDVLEVKTQYSPEDNKKTSYEDQGPHYRADFTANHRRYATQAKSCKDINNLREKLDYQLRKGKKARINLYTTIDAEDYHDKVIRISDKNDALVAMLLANMPQHLRQNIVAMIETAFPEELVALDSSQLPDDYKFNAYHFSYYNRYAVKVYTYISLSTYENS